MFYFKNISGYFLIILNSLHESRYFEMFNFFFSNLSTEDTSINYYLFLYLPMYFMLRLVHLRTVCKVTHFKSLLIIFFNDNTSTISPGIVKSSSAAFIFNYTYIIYIVRKGCDVYYIYIIIKSGIGDGGP